MSSNMRSDGVPPAYKRRGCLGGHFFVVLCLSKGASGSSGNGQCQREKNEIIIKCYQDG